MINKNKSFDTYLCSCSQCNGDSKYKVFHNKNFNSYGIHYIDKCTNIIYSDKSQTLNLKAGYLYLFPSNVEFSISYGNNSEENYYYHTWLSFLAMPSLCDTIIEYNIKEIPALNSILPLLRAATNDSFLQRPGELAFARNKMTSIILTILNDIMPFDKDEDDILQKVIFYIQENLNSDLSIEKLSNIALLNRTYFCKLFTNNMKMSPHKYIIGLKILKGKMLLRANYKMEEIAQATGFSDAKIFSRAFKNHTGYSPQEYKSTETKFE